LQVELLGQVERKSVRAVTLDDHASAGLLVDEASVAEESTTPGDPAIEAVARPAWSDAVPMPIVADLDTLTQRLGHTCPTCRGRLTEWDAACPACGGAVPERMASVDTQRIDVAAVRPRTAPRYLTEVPVIYSSDSLTFDGMARDLSEGGMFIATELLDPVGTECHLAALPDGLPAANFTGVVAHVSHEPSASGRAPGLGVKFTSSSPAGERWLSSFRGRASE